MVKAFGVQIGMARAVSESRDCVYFLYNMP